MTDDIDAVIHEFLLDHGAYPSMLGYRGFRCLAASHDEDRRASGLLIAS